MRLLVPIYASSVTSVWLMSLAWAMGCAGSGTLRFRDDGEGGTSADAADAGVHNGGDAAPPKDAAGLPRHDGSPPSSLFPSHDGPVLACGDRTCLTQGQVCCVYADPTLSAGYRFACARGGACPADDGAAVIELSCELRTHCANNNVCCVGAVAGTDRMTARCLNAHACAPAATSAGAQLCDPAAPGTDCATSAPCSSANIDTWRLPPTFGTCGGVSR